MKLEEIFKIYETQVKGLYEDKERFLPLLNKKGRIDYVKKTSAYVRYSIQRYFEHKKYFDLRSENNEETKK